MTEVGENILIFEPLCGGHRVEFLTHLLRYLACHKKNGAHYTFVVDNTSFIENEWTSLPQVNFETLSEEDRNLLSSSRDRFLGSFAFMRVLKRYLEILKPDRLVIMDLTYLELALCFTRLPCKTSAILFVQYPELRSVSSPSLKTRFKFILKELKTWMLLFNQNLERIYLLNGARACAYLNKRFKTTRFIPIPDPVPELVSEQGFDVHREFRIDGGRKVFLFFGSMSPRKGVEQLVAALERIPEGNATCSAFVFCGRPEPGYEGRYRTMLEQLQALRPDLFLCVREQFLSPGRMRALFEQVDWILLPYARPEYSSGILAHAVAARTPVIGSCDGLVARQIREQGLGLVSSLDPISLSHVLGVASESNFSFDEGKRRDFLEMSCPERFAAMVLGEQ